MEVEIKGGDDDFFKIEVRQFGEQYVACDGERTAIGKTEEDAVKAVEEMQEDAEKVKEIPPPSPAKQKHSAPIENAKGLGWFDGTSWGTK